MEHTFYIFNFVSVVHPHYWELFCDINYITNIYIEVNVIGWSTYCINPMIFCGASQILGFTHWYQLCVDIKSLTPISLDETHIIYLQLLLNFACQWLACIQWNQLCMGINVNQRCTNSKSSTVCVLYIWVTRIHSVLPNKVGVYWVQSLTYWQSEINITVWSTCSIFNCVWCASQQPRQMQCYQPETAVDINSLQ